MIAGHDFRGAARGNACCCWGLRRGGRGRGWRGERHDVGLVEGMLARWQLGQLGAGREEQMCAEAVVGVDGARGGQGDLLGGSGRRHGEVCAGGLRDIHCACLLRLLLVFCFSKVWLVADQAD